VAVVLWRGRYDGWGYDSWADVVCRWGDDGRIAAIIPVDWRVVYFTAINWPRIAPLGSSLVWIFT
jgi:hypothetical protein